MSSTPGKPQAPKAKRQADPGRAARNAANQAKRMAKLNELRQKDPVGFACKVNLKEAKQMNVATDWKSFCLLKAKAFSELWTARAAKPSISEKGLLRKKARYEKLKAMLEAIEKEIS